jgi:tripartite-type tricarboxylate transporter receptor subunit TctC
MTFYTRPLRAALAGCLAVLPLLAGAQAWPAKPVRFVVGYPPGSSPDVQARLIAEPLAKALGQPVVVDNKPGAGGNIGADLIAKAQDDHTIGIVGNGPLTSAKFLYPHLPYDPQKDFAPLALVGAAPLVWVAPRSAAGSGSARDFIRQVKTASQPPAYGSTGLGAGTHLGMEVLREKLGFEALHVPYTGGPAILNAMLGGQLQMALLPASTVAPMVQSGRVVALASTSARRTPLAPDLPALEELGVQGVNIEVWNAVVGPARLSAPARTRLATELARIIDSREMRQKLLVQGWKVDDASPGALARRIQDDTALYGAIISRKGIKLE